MRIDDYIARCPPDVQKLLEQVRQAVRAAAPGAVETIKYGIPTFTLNGNLVHFAAFKNHIGFYPTPMGIGESEKELSRYKQDLIRKIVRYRVKKMKKGE